MEVIILRGMSGSGKSTVAHHLKARHDFPEKVQIVSADDFFMVQGEYRFDPLKITDAHDHCMRRFLSALGSRSYDLVIVDNTNMRLWECSPYVAVARALGAEVKLLHVTCDPKVAVERNVHGVPLSAVLAQYAAFERALPFWEEELA